MLSTWMQRVSRLGVLCAVTLMITGCPGVPTDGTVVDGPCAEDGTCDSGDACNPIECDAESNTCVASEAPCEEGFVCSVDEETGETTCACDDDADCDDGNACTANVCLEGTCGVDAVVVCEDEDMDACTTEACNEETGECEVTETVECEGTDVCDPATGECGAPSCESDEDCDDMVNCTTDTCVEGACEFTAVVCEDDGDACTTDACDEETGECASTAVECPDGQECVEGECQDVAECATDDDCADGESCVDGACVTPDCTEDADCADGEVCDNGTCITACTADEDCADGEVCDTDTGLCETGCSEDADCDDGTFCNGAETCGDDGICDAGTAPCADDEECDEDADECIGDDAENESLTSGTDTITTGSGDDTFDGGREINGGNFFQTLNNADMLNGGSGTDTLNAQFQGGGTTTPGSLAGIEVINCEVTDNNNTTLNALNADSITTIGNTSSQADLTVTNVSTAPTAFNLTNVSQDFSVTITDTALAGSSDSCTVTISGVVDGGTEPVITLQPSAAGSGYETITLVSEGGVANSIDDIVDGNGTSFATLNVQGSQDITVGDPLATTVTTIDGSTASGKINITLPAASHTVTGGSGDDTFTLAGNYDTSDSLDGGDGTDIFASTSADLSGTSSAVTNVSNFETVSITDALAGNLNVTHYGATNAQLAGIDGTARTITVVSGGSVELTADAGANSDTIQPSTDTTADSVTVTLNDADTAAGLLLTQFETVTLDSTGAADGGANVIGTVLTLNNAFTSESLTITGDAALTLTGAVTADVIDASALTAVLTMTAGTAGSSSVTGGTAADTLRGSTAADSISGGDGADTIRGDDGSDSLTGGNGNDIFDGDNGDTDELLTATDTITDFDAGTSTTTNDSFVYDISSIEATTGPTDLVDTSANSAAGADGTYVALSSDGATVANADIVGIIGDYTDAADALANRTSWTITYGATLTDNDAFLIAYTSGSNVRIAVAVDNGGGATSDAVDTIFDIAILQNVSLTNLDSGDFTAQ
ncbi:MAG: hypothetical protein ACPGXK_02960 [Phycisphaerae bacterium]